jgi:Domain of unknown function (DUF5753)
MVETDPILVFGKLLRALRERAGLSQKQLGDMVFCQHILVGDNPPRAWFVPDESILHRLIGSAEIMRAVSFWKMTLRPAGVFSWSSTSVPLRCGRIRLLPYLLRPRGADEGEGVRGARPRPVPRPVA